MPTEKQIKKYDNTTIGRYIRAIENPDSIGFDRERKVWYNPRLDPRGGKGYDYWSRGMGVDVLNNNAAKAYTEGVPNRELTEEEERYFRNKHIKESLDAFQRQAPLRGIPYPTNTFLEAMAVGAIYRGDADQLWDASTPMGRAIRETGDDAEWKFRQALNEYNTSKQLYDRVRNSEKFLDSGSMQTQVVPEYNIVDPTKKHSEGGQIQRHKSWNELSLSEKSEMIKVAVMNGITDLPTIKEKYNEFADGGNIHIAPSKKGTFTAAATKHGMGRAILDGIAADRQALDSLRHTYNTGEPVVMSEFSHTSRHWINDGNVDSDRITPLSPLHNYTIWYDRDKNEMHYLDYYDFNRFEDFVPGEPFTIKGSIKLKK